jgi:hypothetical protein
VARIYAGILGPLAFLTSLARGAIHAQPLESSLLQAWVFLLIFAMAGYALGAIAGHTVENDVRLKLAEEQGSKSEQSPAPKAAA